MSIVFEPLGSTAIQGEGSASGIVRFGGRARSSAVATLPAIATGIVRFNGNAQGFSTAGEPEIPVLASGNVILYGEASGGYRRTELQSIDAPIGFRGMAIAAGIRGIARGSVRAVGNAFAVAPVYEVIGMVETAGTAFGLTGYESAIAVEALRLSEDMRLDLSILVEQRLPLIDVPTTSSEASRSIAESVRFADAMTLTYRLLQVEGLVLGETVTGNYETVARVVDQLMLSGAFASIAEAEALVVSSLVMGMRADPKAQALVVEQLGLGADLSALIELATAIVERLAMADAAVGTGILTALVSESLVLDAPLSSSAELANLVRESVRFALRLSLDSGEYVAWTINTESKHLSSYTQFPANSFAMFNGRALAASSDGLYALEGDTDNGDPIAARVRFALTRMGTGLQKRMPEAFIGYTATGDLLVKVIVTDEQDGKQTHVYRLAPRRAGAPVQGRSKFGRGLRSVYYAFELENVDGANFELDTVEVHPLVLESRTRGNGQGR